MNTKDRNAMIGLDGDDVLFSDGRRLSLSHLNCWKTWTGKGLILSTPERALLVNDMTTYDGLAEFVYAFAQKCNGVSIGPYKEQEHGC